MKKALSLCLSILFLLTMLPLGAIPVAAATSGTTGDCTWTLDGTHLTRTWWATVVHGVAKSQT